MLIIDTAARPITRWRVRLVDDALHLVADNGDSRVVTLPADPESVTNTQRVLISRHEWFGSEWFADAALDPGTARALRKILEGTLG